MLEIKQMENYWYFNLKGDVTDNEVKMLFSKLTELTNSNNKFKFITDSTNLTTISLLHSSTELYNWMYNQRLKIPSTLVCSSLIITNDILKDLINGVFYIIPPLSPTKICKTFTEALTWINERH